MMYNMSPVSLVSRRDTVTAPFLRTNIDSCLFLLCHIVLMGKTPNKYHSSVVKYLSVLQLLMFRPKWLPDHQKLQYRLIAEIIILKPSDFNIAAVGVVIRRFTIYCLCCAGHTRVCIAMML